MMLVVGTLAAFLIPQVSCMSISAEAALVVATQLSADRLLKYFKLL